MREVSDIQATEKLVNRLHGAECVFFGLDVGRVKDYSALAALVRYVFPIENNMNTLVTKYYCVYLHRYDLKTPYEMIEDDAARWWNWADIAGFRKYFVMDMTGVGAPVLEGIRRRRVRTIGVTITGGHQVSNPDIDEYNVPKETLVTQTIRTSQGGRLKGYASIPDWPLLANELMSFKYKIDPINGNLTYEAETEKVHDDLVIALALPIWFGECIVPYRMPVRTGGGDRDDYRDYDPLA